MPRIHPTAIIEENVEIGEVLEAAYKSLDRNLWQKIIEKSETAVQ